MNIFVDLDTPRLQKDWEGLLSLVGKSTEMNSYTEDKALATPGWLQENKEAIVKNLVQRKNRQYFVNNEVNLLVGRIIERLRYAPSFNEDKIPSIDSESGEIILVSSEERRDYRKEEEYNKEILDYLLNRIQYQVDNLAINYIYESEIWRNNSSNITEVAYKCIKSIATVAANPDFKIIVAIGPVLYVIKEILCFTFPLCGAFNNTAIRL